MREQADMFPEVQLEPEAAPDERFTPRSVFDPLRREFGFTLDVCATAESAKLPRFWTKADDALARSWAGERCWCNPPYSDITPWVNKALSEVSAGCLLVVQLLPAWTDREWWESYVEPYRDGRGYPKPGVTLETRFVRGRITFGFPGNPEGEGAGSPPFWTVLLIWRRKLR